MKVRVSGAGGAVIAEVGSAAGTQPAAERRLDGEPVTADVRQIAPGLYSVLLDGRSYEVTFEPLAPGDSTGTGAGLLPGAGGAVGMAMEAVVAVDGRSGTVQVEDERIGAAGGGGAGRPGALGAHGVTVVAPMPGRVVAVPVAVGAAVERGQTVVVLEAMKMESALSTPQAGRVAEILVTPGQTVQRRQSLVKIDD